jgi:hypothetical protein
MAPSGHAKTTRTVSWRGGSVLAGSMMWAALGGGRPPWPRLGHGLSSFPDKGTYRGSPVRVKALAARDVRASTSRAVSCLQKRFMSTETLETRSRWARYLLSLPVKRPFCAERCIHRLGSTVMDPSLTGPREARPS